MSPLDLVRRHATAVRRDIDRRDAAIRAARDTNHTLREIAAAAGLSPEGVAKILRRDADVTRQDAKRGKSARSAE